MLRFTLNKCKHIELTTNAGLQGGDWEMAVMEESVEMPEIDTPALAANEPAPTANEPAQQMQPKDMSTHHQHLTPTFDMAAPADEESALAIEPSLALEFNTAAPAAEEPATTASPTADRSAPTATPPPALHVT